LRKLIYLEKIAEEIGKKHGEDYLQSAGIQSSLTRRLREAALNGELICFDGFGIRQPLPHESTIFTTAEAVNDWFAKIMSPYRYGKSLEKRWLIPDTRDKPPATMDWHIAARYFYRQHKLKVDCIKKAEAVRLVHQDLEREKLFKRGGSELPSIDAISKILQNIEL